MPLVANVRRGDVIGTILVATTVDSGVDRVLPQVLIEIPESI